MPQLTPRTGRERRTEPRYRINRPGVLKNESEGLVAVRVLDLSVSGLRVSLPCRLPLDAEVQVEFEDAVLSGVVRYCQCIGAAAFQLGIWLPHYAPDKLVLSPYQLRVLRGPQL